MILNPSSMSDFKLEEEFVIVDKNGTEHSYHDFTSQGIKQVQVCDLTLKQEIKNSIIKILITHGFEDIKSYGVAHDTSEFVLAALNENSSF